MNLGCEEVMNSENKTLLAFFCSDSERVGNNDGVDALLISCLLSRVVAFTCDANREYVLSGG